MSFEDYRDEFPIEVVDPWGRWGSQSYPTGVEANDSGRWMIKVQRTARDLSEKIAQVSCC